MEILSIDPNIILSSAIGAGGVWAGIRADVKGLRRDVDRLLSKVFS